MPIEIYNSSNLDNIVANTSGTPSPSTGGSGVNRSVSGSNSEGVDSSGDFIECDANGNTEITATLAYSEIPSGALILSLRLLFDYDISGSASGSASSPVNSGVQANFGSGVAAFFPSSSGEIYLSASVGESDTISGTNTSLNLSDSDSGGLEDFLDLTSSPMTREDFIIAYENILVLLSGSGHSDASTTEVNPPESSGPLAVAYSAQIDNWEFQVEWESSGPPPDIEITGNVTVDIDATESGDAVTVDIDASSVYQLGDITANLTVDIDASSQYGQNEIDGNITVDIGVNAVIVLSTDPSGLYTLVPNRTYDTLYNRVDEDDVTTIDVAIPRPFIKTAFIGG